MKKMQRHIRLLLIAAGMLLLSLLFLLIVTPAVYNKTLPDTTNTGALIAMLLAIVLRLPLFAGYLVIIKRIRNNIDTRTGGYIVIGVLLLTLGLLETDGAFAFLDHKDILYVSLLMFAGIFCDLTAATLTFIAVSLKPIDNQMQTAPDKKLLNGIFIGLFILVMIFFAFPWGIILSLAFWIYLGLKFWRKQPFFPEVEETIVLEKLIKRLKGLLVIAIFSFPVAILAIIIHNVRSAPTGGEESLYFYIGIIAEYIFVLSSSGGMLTFFKGRQKSE